MKIVLHPWSDVEIAGDHVYASGEKLPAVTITDGADLIGALSKLRATPNAPSAIREFVRAYGLLGYSTLAEGGPARAKLQGRWLVADRDPVSWLLAHAENVRSVLSVIASPQPAKALANLIQARTGPWVVPTLTGSEEITVSALPKAGQARVNAMLGMVINPNLGQVGRRLNPDGGLTIVRAATIQHVYWTLADAVESTRRPRRCDVCGEWIVPRHGRQVTCAPPPGVTRSRCERRRSQARWREKQAEG